jgi:hypothetical protein
MMIREEIIRSLSLPHTVVDHNQDTSYFIPPSCICGAYHMVLHADNDNDDKESNHQSKKSASLASSSSVANKIIAREIENDKETVMRLR